MGKNLRKDRLVNFRLRSGFDLRREKIGWLKDDRNYQHVRILCNTIGSGCNFSAKIRRMCKGTSIDITDIEELMFSRIDQGYLNFEGPVAYIPNCLIIPSAIDYQLI